jgi:serine/threonine protein kinase
VHHRASDPAYASTVLAAATAREPSSDELIGREVIGQYIVKERLAEGGMGAVYLAEQPSVGRSAVIKVLSPSRSGGREQVARFEQEALAASRLNHPNIVTIYNFGALDDGTLFLAMEHLEGRSLKQLIEAEAPLPVARALAVARQIAVALADAHRHQVVHRDLKPSNVMMVTRGTERDFVKVVDFGVAKIQGTDLTMAGQLCGTPAYMSPEQCRGHEIDGRSDLYSLAIVLFEMLTARLPFVADTPLGFVASHMTQAPPRASTLIDVPDALDALLARALAKDPAERPASADAFVEELDAATSSPSAPAKALVPLPPEREHAVAMPPRAPSAWSRAWAFVRHLWSRVRERLRPRRERPWDAAKRTVTRFWAALPLPRKLTLRQRLRRRRDKLARSLKAWFRRR